MTKILWNANYRKMKYIYFMLHTIKDDNGCLNYTGHSPKGYGAAHVANRMWRISRFVVFYNLETDEEREEFLRSRQIVRHSCNNKACINLKHLLVGTHQDNMNDLADSGALKGVNNPKAKLDEEDVRKIRNLYKLGATVTMLAKDYHVVRSVIYDIVNGRHWRHI